MNKTKYYLRKSPALYRFYRSLRSFYFFAKSFNSPFLSFMPHGHFYSSIPNFREVSLKLDELDRDSKECPGMDLKEESQLELLDSFAVYYDDLPFPENSNETTRYSYNNDKFPYGDVIILYSFLRHFKPKRLIEIGSGFSSTAMLDVNELFLDDAIDFTFIEPYPDVLFSLFSEEDKRKRTVLQKPVQDVPLKLFQELEARDILFVDSSHVVKFGSDVAHILLEILPVLKPGVIIHFHDVHWPFEYPKAWLEEGRAWNEAYFLRTFLQFNTAFEILYYNSFMAKFHSQIIEEKMPLCLKEPACCDSPGNGSIWIRKLS